MFGLFRKKTVVNGGGVQRVFEVVSEFGDMMAKIEAGTFYDVRTLPYSKEEIRGCILTAYSLRTDGETRAALYNAVYCLAQFQEGVGPEPVRLMQMDVATLMSAHQAGKISIEEVARHVASDSNTRHQEKFDALEKRADAERKMNLREIEAIR